MKGLSLLPSPSERPSFLHVLTFQKPGSECLQGNCSVHWTFACPAIRPSMDLPTRTNRKNRFINELVNKLLHIRFDLYRLFKRVWERFCLCQANAWKVRILGPYQSVWIHWLQINRLQEQERVNTTYMIQLTLSPPRVINFDFSCRPHQKYNIMQCDELGFP